MRIRQVKPAFWTDTRIARLSYPARLFYIGTWNLADDAGWIAWEPELIGAELFPHETPAHRLRNIARWTEELVVAERLEIHACGCAFVPTLTSHQRIAGKMSFAAKLKHESHTDKHPVSSREPTVSSREPSRGKVEVMVRGGAGGMPRKDEIFGRTA